MRCITAITVLTVALGVAGCGGRDSSPSTPSANAPAGGGASAQSTAPAPMTPADLQAAMKIIGGRYGAMLKKLKENDAAGAAADGKELATQFGNVEKFWAQHNKADAVKLAQEAGANASAAAGAAAANDVPKAMMAAQNIGGACKQCHGLYREGDATTGFRIKAGAI